MKIILQSAEPFTVNDVPAKRESAKGWFVLELRTKGEAVLNIKGYPEILVYYRRKLVGWLAVNIHRKFKVVVTQFETDEPVTFNVM